MTRALFLALSIAVSAIAEPPALDSQTAIQVEALNRLKGMDLEANEALKNAVLKVLAKTRGTPHFVEIVRDFAIKGQSEELLAYALVHPDHSSGVDAFRLAASELEEDKIDQLIVSDSGPAVIRLIGSSNDQNLMPILKNLVRNESAAVAARKEAVRALAHSRSGAQFLLSLPRENNFPPSIRLTAASELNLAPWTEIKTEAAELLPLPQSSAEPLPPVPELVQRTGDPRKGALIFNDASVACSSCHKVNDQGTDFGPPLTEIGSKLGKDALYESILDPSAGISFGYEGWAIEMKDGEEAFGIISSETADEVTLKTQLGISTKYKKSDIAKRQKLSTSVMPAGLQLNLTTQQLIDLVEYLSTLKKPK